MHTTKHDWITTPVTADLLRGALDLERTAHGVLPHRLPAPARAQYADRQLAMAEAQPSGVRLVFRTRATAVELDTLPTKRVYVGAPPRGCRTTRPPNSSPCAPTPPSSSYRKAGLGLAVLPNMVADRRPLRVTPFAPPGLHRTIGLAHRKDVEPPRAARELRHVLLEYLDHAAATGTLPPGTHPA